MRKTLSALALLLALGAMRFGWNLIDVQPSLGPSGDDPAWFAQDDRDVEGQIARGAAAPAGDWLDSDRHMTVEADELRLDALIDDFHAAGAERVWITNIEPFGGSLLSDTIAVELPPEPSRRADLFGLEAELWAGVSGTPDVGQRYLTVWLD